MWGESGLWLFSTYRWWASFSINLQESFLFTSCYKSITLRNIHFEQSNLLANVIIVHSPCFKIRFYRLPWTIVTVKETSSNFLEIGNIRHWYLRLQNLMTSAKGRRNCVTKIRSKVSTLPAGFLKLIKGEKWDINNARYRNEVRGH